MRCFVVLLGLVALTTADLYMHNPRGSNNRLNERSANRNNGNRMFDSQNNNRGGYNKGDVDNTAASATPRTLTSYQNEFEQYDMKYYMSADPNACYSSVDGAEQTAHTSRSACEADGHIWGEDAKSFLTFEWTNQHGCGGNEHGDSHKLNCQIIIQYQCHNQWATTSVSDDCTKRCMKPVDGNAQCDVKPDAMNDVPACPIIEGMHNQAECVAHGYVWADMDMGDILKYNCPHKCTDGSGVVITDDSSFSKAECEAVAGQVWNAAPTRSSGDNNLHSWGRSAAGSSGSIEGVSDELYPMMYDGTTTNRQEFTNPSSSETESDRFTRKFGHNGEGNVRLDRGLHESWDWYDECYRRERNRGLFTADQNLRNNNLGYSSAVYTRQNPNNNRRGYECPEERDYYPYWHPNGWRDIVVMTDRLDQCDFYQSESQNVKSKHKCMNTMACQQCVRYNNERQCRDMGGAWVEFASHGIDAPKCIQAPWSRVNHLGNGRHGQANSYNWTLPFISMPDGSPYDMKCVARMRYNISTDDYDAWRVNSTFNNNNGQGIRSPVRQNPNVDIGAENQALRLAINTAQFGRTFQDRSHVFVLRPRPILLTTSDATRKRFATRNIYNVNVRGKRGNIVQTFPSVEYDFMPNHLHIEPEDLVHFQWTGSNTHNNGNPAGDGQAGDAGEGTGGTDRHNVVELKSAHFNESFPATWEENTLFKNAQWHYRPAVPGRENEFTDPTEKIPEVDCASEDVSGACTEWQLNAALRMGSVGYYTHYRADTDDFAYNDRALDTRHSNGEMLNNLLNNADASFDGGLFQFRRGSYNFMCTRNHNFSNRDQKGHLNVGLSR